MAAVAYEQFLAAPNASLLADKATLHYVTTTTTFDGAADIIKHLSALQKQVKKTRQNVLNVVDGKSIIAVEVETGLEFQTSGGVYLPGLDDNFLNGHTAYLPVMHIVTFNDAGKIDQIRQQWDQGSLLKQLDIIGKTGRNWPIKDSREQLSMIQSCLKSLGPTSPTTQGQDDVAIRTRGRSTNAFRDPHASLQLFGSREELEAAEPASVISPYGGSRPRQRDFAEIFSHGSHAEDADSAHHDRPLSPSKAGQGKNYQPMRIFDGQEHNGDEEETPKGKSGHGYIRHNPRKYDHFDLIDGSDPQDKPKPGSSHDERPKSKHDSQWSFDDFVTPHKPKPTKSFRHQDVRHWDTEANNMGDAEKPVGKSRRDAETHFELQDDGERVPRQERPGTKPRGSAHNEGLGLYKNIMSNQDDATPGPKRALGNITNLKDRTKDFDAHFAMTDESPSQESQRLQHVPEGRMKAVKMMNANWSAYDQSPAPHKEKKPRGGRTQENMRIHTAGDGMGGKKSTGRDWLYGDGGAESDGIHIAGDGMGGRKGTDRNWLYGGDDDAEPPKTPVSRKGGNPSAAQKSSWDF